MTEWFQALSGATVHDVRKNCDSLLISDLLVRAREWSEHLMMLLQDLEVVLVVVDGHIWPEDMKAFAIQEADQMQMFNFGAYQATSLGAPTVAPKDQISVEVPHFICMCASGLRNMGVPMGSPLMACDES